jgi:hypothetical protein
MTGSSGSFSDDSNSFFWPDIFLDILMVRISKMANGPTHGVGRVPSKSCSNEELFDRKPGVQIAKRAGSEIWEIIQLATSFDAEANLWHPFFDTPSNGTERSCSSSLRASSHHLSSRRAPLGLEMGRPRWCHRIWRELRWCREIESLFKIVIKHVSTLNAPNFCQYSVAKLAVFAAFWDTRPGPWAFFNIPWLFIPDSSTKTRFVACALLRNFVNTLRFSSSLSLYNLNSVVQEKPRGALCLHWRIRLQPRNSAELLPGKVGRICQKFTPLTRSPNEPVSVAVSSRLGLIHYTVQHHLFNQTAFCELMPSLWDVLGSDARAIYFVFDNCWIHHEEDLSEIREIFRYDYRFLPPYSRQLVPSRKSSARWKILSGDCLQRISAPNCLDWCISLTASRPPFEERLLLNALQQVTELVTVSIVA